MSIVNTLFGVAGKRVLVTGASRGIGLAIARAFVEAGARVYVCSRSAASCAAAAEELAKLGNCVAIPCNVSSGEDRARLVQELRRHEQALDVVVNNAGALWAAPLAEYPETGWDKVFDLNVKGVFFLVQQLLPLLEASASADDPARIINIGSIDAFRVPPHESYAYAASKAALHQLTRQLASQLASHHITANVIAPGMFPSKMLAAPAEAEALQALVATIPLKRLANDADLAAAALYLASRAGSYVTGAVLPVDGGVATTL